MKAREILFITFRVFAICWQTEVKQIGRILLHAACTRKVRCLSMKGIVPSGGEFKHMEIPSATFEVGSFLRKLGEESTLSEQLDAIIHKNYKMFIQSIK